MGRGTAGGRGREGKSFFLSVPSFSPLLLCCLPASLFLSSTAFPASPSSSIALLLLPSSLLHLPAAVPFLCMSSCCFSHLLSDFFPLVCPAFLLVSPRSVYWSGRSLLCCSPAKLSLLWIIGKHITASTLD